MSCLHQHSQLNPIVSRADMLYHNILTSLLFHDLHTSHTTSSSHTTNKQGHTPTINTHSVTHPHTTNPRIATKTKTQPRKTPPLARIRLDHSASSPLAFSVIRLIVSLKTFAP